MTIELSGVTVDRSAVVGTETQPVQQWRGGRWVDLDVQVPVTLGQLLDRQTEKARRAAAQAEVNRGMAGIDFLPVRS